MGQLRRTVTGAFLIGIALATAGCGEGGSTAAVAANQNSGNQQQAGSPAAPAGVSAVSGINKITLAWDAVPGATSYNIYWSISPGVTAANGNKIAGVTGTSYHHVGLLVSQTYFYVVTADSSAGESPASSQAATVVATDGANLYATFCSGCHGPVTATSIMGGTPDQIKAAIAGNRGGMGKLSSLTSDQIGIISQQLPCH